MYTISNIKCWVSRSSSQVYVIYAFLINQSLNFGLLFLRDLGLLANFTFFLSFGESLIPKGAYRAWDHFWIWV